MSNNNSFYSQARTNTVLAVMSTGVTILLSTAITPMIVLLIGAENWARYAFFLLYVAALQCVEAAIQAYSLQLNAIARSTGRRYEWRFDNALRRAIVFGVVIVIALLVGDLSTRLISDAEMRTLFALALANVIPRAICAILKGNLLGQRSQKGYYLATTVFNIGRPFFLLLGLLVFNVRAVEVLAALYVVFSFAELSVLWFVLSGDSAVDCAAGRVSEEKNLLPTLFASNLMSTVSTNFDRILAYGSLTLRILGEYTFASQLAALLYVLVNAAVAAFSPKFRELYIRRRLDDIRRYLLILSMLNNFFILIAAGFFVMNADFFLSVFSGHLDHERLMTTFIILAAAALTSSNLWFPGAIATSMGKAHFSVFTNIGFVLAYLCSFLMLRQLRSDLIFSVSLLCSALVTTAAGLLYFKLRVLPISLVRYLIVTFLLPIFVVGLTYFAPAMIIKQNSVGMAPGLMFALIWSVALGLLACYAKPVLFRGEHA